MVCQQKERSLSGIVGAGTTYPAGQIVSCTILGGAARIQVILQVNDFPDV